MARANKPNKRNMLWEFLQNQGPLLIGSSELISPFPFSSRFVSLLLVFAASIFLLLGGFIEGVQSRKESAGEEANGDPSSISRSQGPNNQAKGPSELDE